jgi:opacity protein-like surface antigen
MPTICRPRPTYLLAIMPCLAVSMPLVTGAALASGNVTFYGGALGGYADASTRLRESYTDEGTPVADGFRGTVQADGLTGALFGGFQMPAGPVLLGIEVDYGGGDIEGAARLRGDLLPGSSVGAEVEVRSLGHLRGRLMLPLRNGTLIPFLALGAARADVESRVNGGDYLDDTATGWCVGIGLDWNVGDHLVVRAEVQRDSFDTTRQQFFDSPDGFLDPTRELRIDDIDMARAGLAWRF